MHEYDFYLSQFNYYKDKDLNQVDPQVTARTAQSKKKFPSLYEAMAASLKDKFA
jgi:hypothetical protein